LGYEGGFEERLKEGTYIGHVTEHLIIELQNILGYEVNYGKTRIVEEPSLYFIVFEYKNEKCAIECARAAVNIVLKLVRNEEVDTEAIINNLRAIAVETDMGPSTKAIYEEAKRGNTCNENRRRQCSKAGIRQVFPDCSGFFDGFSELYQCRYGRKQTACETPLGGKQNPCSDGDTAYSFEGALQIARR